MARRPFSPVPESGMPPRKHSARQRMAAAPGNGQRSAVTDSYTQIKAGRVRMLHSMVNTPMRLA